MISPKPRRRNLRWLIILLLIPAVWFGMDAAYIAIGSETDHAVAADVIVVLGCNPYGENGPSPCMIARAGHAADLYKQHYASAIIATGNPTESSTLRRVLESDGVPADAIITESNSRNTIQNIANTQPIILAHNWHTAILVTEPFHINRSTLIAHDIWGQSITVYPSPAVNSENWNSLYTKVYTVSRDTVSLMLYQIKSLIGQRD
ncbi:MAG: YdcF family protein [Chloroflexia bacterium]